MSKTAILKKIEDAEIEFEHGVKFLEGLLENPGDLRSLDTRMKKAYEHCMGLLGTMDQGIQEFHKKIDSWKNPTFLSKLKNLTQKKQLEEDRKKATEQFNNLVSDLFKLRADMTLFRQMAGSPEYGGFKL
jgi:hypothetical protein